MKVVITENKRNSIITKWLDINYGDLKKYSIGDRYVEYLDKGNNSVFTFSRETDIVELYQEITTQLVSIFGITSGTDINNIFIPWLMDRYNLHVKRILYTTWHCNNCGGYHITNYHIED